MLSSDTVRNHAAKIIRRMFPRRNGYGVWSGGRWKTEKTSITEAVIRQAMDQRITVAAHTTSSESECYWVCYDLDNHDKSPEQEEANTAAVFKLAQALSDADASPLVELSNRYGCYHVWVIFDKPVPAWVAYDWMRSFPCEGFECFPKQRTLAPGAWGNFVRLPGLHHRTGHVSVMMDEHGDAVEPTHAPLAVLASWTATPPPVWTPETAADGSAYPETVYGAAAGEGLDVAEAQQKSCDAERLEKAIRVLHDLPARCREVYDEWVAVGQCLHHESGGHVRALRAWEAWSMGSAKYQEGDCEAKWTTFGSHSTPAGLGTLYRMAGSDQGVEDALERLESSVAAVPRAGGDVSQSERQTVLQAVSDILGVTVTGWVQRGGDIGTSMYYLRIGDGQEVPVGTSTQMIATPTRVRAALMESGIGFVHSKKLTSQKWQKVLQYLTRIVEREETHEDRAADQLIEAIQMYLDRTSISNWDTADEDEDRDRNRLDAQFLARQPIVRDGRVHISYAHFRNSCKASRVDLPPNHTKLLAMIGARRVTLSRNKTSRSYYILPQEVARVDR